MNSSVVSRTIAAVILSPAVTGLIAVMTGCGGSGVRMPPAGPSPSPTPVTANAYILPGAGSLGDWAFGDEPIVVYSGERLRWVNLDALTHVIVADSPETTDFRKTDELPSNGQQSFIMTKLGTTRIHCA